MDALGHAALEREKDAVVRRFGSGILGIDGRIDRKRLGAIVFADRRKRESLEEIVHPWMISEVEKAVARGAEPAETARYAVNAALLFQMGLHRSCDVVLWISAPLLRRIQRARKRDGLSLPKIFARIWAQRKLSPQPWMKAVDIHTISNSVGEEELASVILRVLK